VTPSPSPGAIETLAPRYVIPIVLFLLSFPSFWWQPWLGVVVALLAVFLLVQTLIIRLQFTRTDLDLYRGETLIRRFPYKDWSNWEIFWPGVPVLFYFREVNSIHFMPILFDSRMLQLCLEKNCPVKFVAKS